MFDLKYERRRRKKHIPEEIWFEILARLPVKSLLRFRCVCKSWNTLISSPGFKTAHLGKNIMRDSYDYFLIRTANYRFSLYCRDTVAKCLDLELPEQENISLRINGSCNGLLCLSNHLGRCLRNPIYLWNPSIRKFKRLPKGLIQHTIRFDATGIGFHSGENDYKVVRIVRFLGKKCIFEVEVYSVRLDAWKRISAVPPLSPNVSSFNTNAFAYIDGVVYWIVFDHSQQRSSILSFDFVGEVFQKIELPDKMGKGIEFFHTSIGVFERLVSMFHYRQDGKDYNCDIWVLEMETWKMIRTIIFPERGWITWPLGFRATGGVHMVMLGGDFILYGPEPRQLNPLGIKLHDGYVSAYSESLILLD
ncbi:hypothetical protein C1H46_026003 [Malus baccata]|uniref:F-box domain-containing protein n=1 Tax=Malus baccata TaxID=106549 RepID=A0A540LQ91_MALBA|nr:hypothetical protein C1H46_026003 [Malus baccata]